MNINEARRELRTMSVEDLFNLTLNQKMSGCVIGRGPCRFYLQYNGSSFCVSEILRMGCQLERLEQLEQNHHYNETTNFLFPHSQKIEREFSSSEVKGIEFKVYHRDSLTGSVVLLGRITERRRKERGNNLRDLLGKAMREYSDYVEDSSTIFLLR
jgi:hypothetical protein